MKRPAPWLDLAALAGAVAFVPLVLTRIGRVAFDSDLDPRVLLTWLAASLVVGVAVGNFVAASRSRWVLSALVGALLVALAEIGEPGWVAASVVTGSAGCVAVALSAVVSVERAWCDEDLGVGAARCASAAAIGLVLGLANSVWSPNADWAVSSAVAGALCLAAGVLGVSQPDRPAIAATVDARRARRQIDGATLAMFVRRPLRWHALLAVGLWPLMAGQIQIDSVVGPRYPQLTIGLAALVVFVGAGIGHLLDTRRRDSATRQAQVVHVAAAIGGLSALVGTMSHTLIGAVVGWGLAVGTLAIGWVHAALAVSSDPDPVGRSVAIGRVFGAVILAAAAGLLAAAAAQPRHHTWWLTVVAALTVHQSVRRLRRMKVDDVHDATTEVAIPRGTTRVAARRNSSTLLDVDRVDSGYGGLQVLFGVDLAVARGEVVALLGPNGAGKTTLLRTIAGLHPTWNGRVQFGGVDLIGLDAAGRVGAGLMLVSPESAIARTLTVDDNLRLFSHLLSPNEARSARRRVYESFPRLQERVRQTASTLSGGERQMLALSRALILRPEMLLIDELTLGLSPQAIADLGPALGRLNAEGTALMIVDQSAAVALTLASRALVLQRGALTADFPAERLRERPDLLRQIHLEGIDAVLDTGVST